MLVFTKHFHEMLKQRNIAEAWVKRTIDDPDKIESHDGGITRHYLKKIIEIDDRWLRVVVNANDLPNKAITVFFDRRLRRKHENYP